MSEDEQGLAERMDDFAPQAVEGDYTTSPEALTVLRERGVQAWWAWCAQQPTRD